MNQTEKELLTLFQYSSRDDLHDVLLYSMGRFEMNLPEKNVKEFNGMKNIPLGIAHYVHGNNEGLTIYYSNNHPISVSIVNLSDSMIETIKQKTNSIIDKTEKVGHNILFSNKPIKGYFKYKDKFRLLPVPQGSPRFDNDLNGPHPILLEFKYSGFKTEEFLDERHIVDPIKKEITLLLNTFLMQDFILESNHITYEWGLDVDSHSFDSILFQRGYWMKNYSTNNKDFSPLDNLDVIETCNTNDYWHVNNVYFCVPDYLTTFLDKYYSRDPKTKERFEESMYWFVMAKNQRSNSLSAASVFLSMSLERLVDSKTPLCTCGNEAKKRKVIHLIHEIIKKEGFENMKIQQIIKDSKEEESVFYCKNCKRVIQVAKGSGKLFTELLDTYFPTDDERLTREKNGFYSKIRSAIAHGGMLQEDKKTTQWGLNQQEQRTELFLEINQRILLNWFYNI